MPPEAGNGDAEQLLAHFLAGRTDRTRRAYTADLEDFSRALGRSPSEAVAGLLSGPHRARRMVLDYAVDLRRRGLAPATVQRRLGTLRALVGVAAQTGAVEWSLQVPTEEEVAAADRANRDGVAYFLPHRPDEIDRLDVQHYALRAALGAHYLAPLEQPTEILDVGSGTGQWAYDLCAEFPRALVVGFDLEPSKRPWPPAYRCVRGNLLLGLPFASDRFDFVHQRALISGVPVNSWPSVCRDLGRVVRPGGWVELVECPPWFESAGPVTTRLCEMLQRLLAARGLDSAGRVVAALDDHLERSGLIDIRRRDLDVQVGEWGGRVGSLMATDCRALFFRLGAAFEAAFGIGDHEYRDLVTAMQQEWEQFHTTYRFVFALGMKPD
ncbi:MAG TPA: methyltransferase domain-containing protein [Terriglobales bacterium]|nr:methyltransferase domain-containing protein [Terriglobales bacterium]